MLKFDVLIHMLSLQVLVSLLLLIDAAVDGGRKDRFLSPYYFCMQACLSIMIKCVRNRCGRTFNANMNEQCTEARGQCFDRCVSLYSGHA